MSNSITHVSAQPLEVIPPQAENDGTLIRLWLHGRSQHTSRAYQSDVASFRCFVRKPLVEVTLADLQRFADSLADHLEPSSRHRRLSSIKSLFAFGFRLGYFHFDVARPLRLPTIRDRLAERILTEEEVHRMLAMERHPRNHVLLCLMYASAVRVSELCSLKWRDVQPRDEGGQISVLGKGGKTNSILLPPSIWAKLPQFRGTASEGSAVFRSRKGAHLHPTQVRRIVRRAADRAGIGRPVSPHFLRHSHASHALDRGAPIHLVQATLAHSSIATTGRYLHARPSESSATYLAL